jgi:endoglucanase
VIIDWHVMNDRNPNAYKADALEFFTEMAERYGEYPNVIYELCNEPNGEEVTWDGDVKPYAEEVIAAIRKIDGDNIIIVGSPTWSQDVDKAADNPITGQSNIMYTLHFYAGTHGEPLMKKAEYALSKGIPIFVTEWGTTLATGDQFRPEMTIPWIEFMDRNRISWANWSVSNDGKDSSILSYNADKEGKGGWKDDQISPSGRLVRGLLRNENIKKLVKVKK